MVVLTAWRPPADGGRDGIVESTFEGNDVTNEERRTSSVVEL